MGVLLNEIAVVDNIKVFKCTKMWDKSVSSDLGLVFLKLYMLTSKVAGVKSRHGISVKCS